MFLFLEYHIPTVLDGTKTQTRRRISYYKRGPKKSKPVPPKKAGSIQQIKREMFGESRGRMKVLRQWEERLGDISKQDALAEGGYTQAEYIRGFLEMHQGRVTRDSIVYCYEFKHVKEGAAHE